MDELIEDMPEDELMDRLALHNIRVDEENKLARKRAKKTGASGRRLRGARG